jgi:hypothetical protein
MFFPSVELFQSAERTKAVGVPTREKVGNIDVSRDSRRNQISLASTIVQGWRERLCHVPKCCATIARLPQPAMEQGG